MELRGYASSGEPPRTGVPPAPGRHPQLHVHAGLLTAKPNPIHKGVGVDSPSLKGLKKFPGVQFSWGRGFHLPTFP